MEMISGLMSNMAKPASLASGGPATLSLARRFNSTGSAKVLKFDQARAQALKRHGSAGQSSPSAGDGSGSGLINVDATSQVVSYVVTVEIGTPPVSYQLLIDTGSSNTWAGADPLKPLKPSSTTLATGDYFHVSYGSGSVTGIELMGNIKLAEGLTLPNQSIGASIFSQGFSGVDGIMGIGPQDLTCGTFVGKPDKCVPTVTDSAEEAGFLDSYEIGISFQPSSTVNKKNGELTFGGIDESKFTGPLNWTPLTTTEPSSYFVGIDQSIIYGSKESVLHEAAGILDTGTTLILIASDAFENYKTYTGGVVDEDVGLLRITPAQYAGLESLFFHIGGVVYELTPNAQIWPRALNAEIGGSPDSIYLIVNDFGSPSGEGLDFINGMSFLERFYMVYDVGNNRAALARTEYTYAEIN